MLVSYKAKENEGRNVKAIMFYYEKTTRKRGLWSILFMFESSFCVNSILKWNVKENKTDWRNISQKLYHERRQENIYVCNKNGDLLKHPDIAVWDLSCI